MVKAVQAHPSMNNSYKVVDGKPVMVTPEHINLGLAIDMVSKNGARNLVVAAIRACETLTFDGFVEAYEDIVRRARNGKLTMDDFSGVTIQLTNPRHRHSPPVPRLTRGQGTIIGVGLGLPGRVRRCVRGPSRRDGCRQACHHDLHLRPPHHPRCGVR